MNRRLGDLTSISTIEGIQLKFFSLIWGSWYIFRRLAKNLWTSNRKLENLVRNPPKCLTDSSLGHHSYIKLKGVKLHYVDAGKRSQPLVILLHGFPDCWITWKHQIPELAKYFRVVALDLKGFGESDKPESCSHYQIAKLVEEIGDLVTTLGYRRCILIGHDLGALISWFVVHLNPDIVDKFVAIAAPHPNHYWNTIPSSSVFNSSWVQLCQLPFLPEKKAMDDDLSLISENFRHLKNNAEFETFLSAYKYSFSRTEDWVGAINYFRTLPYWRIKRKEIDQVATLLIFGNKDNAITMESIVKSCDYLEKYSVKVVENVGHYPHHESPEELNEILMNYLIGVSAVPAEKPQTNSGLVNIVFGAVSSTVKYGNSVFDAVQKKTNGIKSRALLGQNT